MFCQLYQDALTEYTYAAELAGLGYNIQNTIYGLIVSQLFCVFHCFVIIVRTDNTVVTTALIAITSFVG